MYKTAWPSTVSKRAVCSVEVVGVYRATDFTVDNPLPPSESFWYLFGVLVDGAYLDVVKPASVGATANPARALQLALCRGEFFAEVNLLILIDGDDRVARGVVTTSHRILSLG